MSECSAACAASSNFLSNISLVPRRPMTTFRAQEMYSIFRRIDRSGAGGSIAAAEVNLGDILPEKIQAVETLMTRARDADRAGDQSACEQALAEVQRVFFQ